MDIIGKSKQIQAVKELIEQVAGTQANVLILGESGTGKELIARNIHATSSRCESAFIPVNCAAIPSELLESELFGHEKGAFTGAVSFRQGRFELANNGTIFLDEIGDMPLNMQVKLLRVLQERCFERIGGTKTIKSNVRIIAATHQKLEDNIENGKFREDLYYRLNVFPIHIPSLRDRLEDVPLLVDYFMRTLRKELAICKLSDSTVEQLSQYDWPGNVRELANIMERLCILFPDKIVEPHQLPDKILNKQSPTTHRSDLTETVMVKNSQLLEGEFDLKQHMIDLETNLINEALAKTNGVVSRAAKKLGIRRTTLVEKMRKYQLGRDVQSCS